MNMTEEVDVATLRLASKDKLRIGKRTMLYLSPWSRIFNSGIRWCSVKKSTAVDPFLGPSTVSPGCPTLRNERHTYVFGPSGKKQA